MQTALLDAEYSILKSVALGPPTEVAALGRLGAFLPLPFTVNKINYV
jgi:hypothetical protein